MCAFLFFAPRVLQPPPPPPCQRATGLPLNASLTPSPTHTRTPPPKNYVLDVTPDGHPVVLIRLAGLKALLDALRAEPGRSVDDLDAHLAFFNEYL